MPDEATRRLTIVIAGLRFARGQRRKDHMRSLSPLALFALLLASGCAFSPRVVLLQNHEPIVDAGVVPQLTGKRVAIVSVDDARKPDEVWKVGPLTPEPAGYRPRDVSATAEDAWSKGKEAAERGTAPRYVIGCVRNGFGMRTADVVALDAPATWMRETLEREIVNQGGTIAESRENSDVSIAVSLRHIDADLYFSVSCRIVVDVTVGNGRGLPDKSLQVTAKGSCGTWAGSSWDYYLAIREAQQKVMWHVLRALAGIDPPERPPATNDSSDFGS